MLKNLGWEKYTSVVEDNVQTMNLLNAVADLSDGQICPVEKPIMLPKSDSGYAAVYREIMDSKINNFIQ